MKICLGVAHGSAQTGVKPFFHFSLRFGMRKGKNESVMALTGFLLVDIIAPVPSDYIFVNKRGDGVMGSPISRLKW